MLSFRNCGWALLCCISFCSCKARKYTFDESKFIQSVKPKIVTWVTNDHSKKDSVTETFVYEATLAEKLVEQNSVSDYRLVNKASRQPIIPVDIYGYSHKLYLFNFVTRSGEKYVILLHAGFNPDNKCIGIGPAYAGSYDFDFKDTAFQITKVLHIKTTRKQPREIKEIKPGEDFVLWFIADKPLTGIEKVPVKITSIIQSTKNKIAGLEKELVYTTEKVFNDPDALVFTLMK